jgi:hypothetical protein
MAIIQQRRYVQLDQIAKDKDQSKSLTAADWEFLNACDDQSKGAAAEAELAVMERVLKRTGFG